MKLHTAILLILLPLLLPSCADKPGGEAASAGKTSAQRNIVTYKAIAAQGGLPGRIYLFPPLRSNSKGTPIEKLTAVSDDAGNVIDWKASSAKSNQLHSKLRAQLRVVGYDVIDFSELVKTRQPYSVLVLSSFYSSPSPVEKKEGEPAAMACLVMLKGSLFGLDLNPANKRDVIQVDGLARYPAESGFKDPEGKGLSVLFSKIGENDEGYTFVD